MKGAHFGCGILLLLLGKAAFTAGTYSQNPTQAEPQAIPKSLIPTVTIPAKKWPYTSAELGLQFGGFIEHAGRSQHVNINTLIGDYFSVSKHHSSNGLVGLSYFLDGMDNAYFSLRYGVQAFYLPTTSVKGAVTQENAFTNLSYKYNLVNWPIYATVKGLVNNPYYVRLPLVFDVGLGPNILQTKNFSETSLGSNTIPDLIFSNRTTAVFSATASAGLRFNDLIGPASLECAYRFFYLGQSSLNIANSQVQNALNTGITYANAVVCSMIV